MSTTIKQALASAHTLSEVSETYQLDAQLLLAHVLDKPREYLFTWPDEVLSESCFQSYLDLIQRRAKAEPVAYLVGRQAFWDFELDVTSSVLSPRPETELLVEKALSLFAGSQNQTITMADLGCGSGAIAIALAKENPSWSVSAVDKSSSALEVAIHNAKKLEISNIEFSLGSWCDSLAHNSFDLITANPPYVEEGDAHLLKGSLPFEPRMALVADNQGLGDLEAIIKQSQHWLKANGWLMLEHGHDQGALVKQRLVDAGYSSVDCASDLAGIPRMTFAQWQGTG